MSSSLIKGLVMLGSVRVGGLGSVRVGGLGSVRVGIRADWDQWGLGSVQHLQ